MSYVWQKVDLWRIGQSYKSLNLVLAGGCFLGIEWICLI